tara:strand:- start:908 stop:1090 length:183 start_codon:yes stop_codon:yes gene_type:complete
MDNGNQQSKKPITEIMIILKDIRSDIAQIKRDIVLLKNEMNKINSGKETDTTSSGGWFFT